MNTTRGSNSAPPTQNKAAHNKPIDHGQAKQQNGYGGYQQGGAASQGPQPPAQGGQDMASMQQQAAYAQWYNQWYPQGQQQHQQPASSTPNPPLPPGPPPSQQPAKSYTGYQYQ